MHQHVHHGKNKTINSSPQIEIYKNEIDDMSIKVGDVQRVITLDKHKVSTNVRNSLPYMSLRPHTENEWGKMLHTILASDKDWDLTALDFKGEVDNELWFDSQSSFLDSPDYTTFNEVSDYRLRSNNH